MATKSVESTPRGLQKSFVFGLAVIYLLEAALVMMSVVSQYQSNPNLSGYYITLSQTIAIPLVLVLGAWFLSPRKISRLGKAFETTLIAFIGFMAMVASAITITYWPIPYYTDAYPWESLYVPIIVTVVYLGLLWWLRTSGRWK